jgi:signal peptidase I
MRLRALSALLPLALIAGCKNPGDRLPFRTFKISSGSMEPTLYAGDVIYVDQRYYKSHTVADGDLIVFHHEDYILIKRVSALPGETIEGHDNFLYRNGTAFAEPYAHYDSANPIRQDTFAAVKVPAGQLFVTGDNRDQSLDSRTDDFGPVLTADVVGRAESVYQSTHAGQTGRKLQ